MGLYINPAGETKEDWLTKHARIINQKDAEIMMTKIEEEIPICLVKNQLFSAAAIIYDDREMREFTRTDDHRPKKYFAVKIQDLEDVTDFQSLKSRIKGA